MLWGQQGFGWWQQSPGWWPVEGRVQRGPGLACTFHPLSVPRDKLLFLGSMRVGAQPWWEGGEDGGVHALWLILDSRWE